MWSRFCKALSSGEKRSAAEGSAVVLRSHLRDPGCPIHDAVSSRHEWESANCVCSSLAHPHSRVLQSLPCAKPTGLDFETWDLLFLVSANNKVSLSSFHADHVRETQPQRPTGNRRPQRPFDFRVRTRRSERQIRQAILDRGQATRFLPGVRNEAG